MTGIGWEIWGLKFSWFFTALLSVIMMVYTWLTAHDAGSARHLDTMAGDEGEEW